jgi:hypothetical protein
MIERYCTVSIEARPLNHAQEHLRSCAAVAVDAGMTPAETRIAFKTFCGTYCGTRGGMLKVALGMVSVPVVKQQTHSRDYVAQCLVRYLLLRILFLYHSSASVGRTWSKLKSACEHSYLR